MAEPIESLIRKHNPTTLQEYENALKEIIQEISLLGLARGRFFEKAAFYGGTALRLFHGLPRFSEDMDFTLLKPQPDFKLKPYFASIMECLKSFGFEIEISEILKPEDRAVESVLLKANTRSHLGKIELASPLVKKIQLNQLLKIKMEVDTQSPSGFETEAIPLLPPVSASIRVLKPSSLFAGKLHAVLFRQWKGRVRWRDFYDLLWFLGQAVPVQLSYLEAKMQQGGMHRTRKPLSRAVLLQLLQEKINSIDWESAKKDVFRFLRDPHEVDPWNVEFFLAAIRSLKCL